MRKGKWGSVFAVVALFAVVGVLWGRQLTRASRMPKSVSEEPIRRMDAESFEVIALSLGEWMKLEGPYNAFKNPKTGKFTMVDIMRCRSCGAEIPCVVVTEEIARQGPAALEALQAQHKCPRCGK